MNIQRQDIDVRTSYLIVNEYPTDETLDQFREDGNRILMITLARNYHPYALDNDFIIFMAKPIDKEKYDEYMASFVDDFEYKVEQDPEV